MRTNSAYAIATTALFSMVSGIASYADAQAPTRSPRAAVLSAVGIVEMPVGDLMQENEAGYGYGLTLRVPILPGRAAVRFEGSVTQMEAKGGAPAQAFDQNGDGIPDAVIGARPYRLVGGGIVLEATAVRRQRWRGFATAGTGYFSYNSSWQSPDLSRIRQNLAWQAGLGAERVLGLGFRVAVEARLRLVPGLRFAGCSPTPCDLKQPALVTIPITVRIGI